MGKLNIINYITPYKFFFTCSLDYTQCTSGTTATHNCSGMNTVGMMFHGTSREMSTCTFNLTSGKCISENETCMISHQPSLSMSAGARTLIPFMSSVSLSSPGMCWETKTLLIYIHASAAPNVMTTIAAISTPSVDTSSTMVGQSSLVISSSSISSMGTTPSGMEKNDLLLYCMKIFSSHIHDGIIYHNSVDFHVS